MSKKKATFTVQSKNNIPSALDLNIDSAALITAATELTNLLNRVSSIIQEIEDGLRSLSANFPFKKIIYEEPESIEKKPEDRHQKIGEIDPYHDVMRVSVSFYKTQHKWLFSWEEDEQSKDNKFRLFLIKTENEVVHLDYGDFGDGPIIRPEMFEKRILFKKPLRQTKLALRLKFIEYLKAFVDEFEYYLHMQYIVIKEGNPFEGDVSF